MLQINTLFDGTPFYTTRLTLDGSEYLLELAWGTRESRWFLSLRDSLGVLLFGPVKVVANWPLSQWYHHRDGVPAGEFTAVCLQADVSPPGLTELGIGQRVTLCYTPVDELP